jgi:general secretion pathway protein M
MSDRFLLWWGERSPRERGLVAIMAILALIVLGWLLIARPLADQLDAAKTRYAAATVALAEARAREDATGAGPAAAPGMPVDSLLGAAATQAGFTNARIAAQGPMRATVTIDSARPQALFAWLGQLERRGLAVERLGARTNSDRTIAVEAVLRARGR